MLNINNETAKLKQDILVRIARLQLEGNLETGVRAIPRKMASSDAKSFRCCVYHDREILRMRTIASLGYSVETGDDDTELDEYARGALTRECPTQPMLTVLDEACNSCVRSHYMVTNACRACIARPCMKNCPKKCIDMEKGQARIDASICVNCGMCMQNCPYHAIVKLPVPCEEACPVGAIAKDESGKERIDYDKCIFCGSCMRECPFGAMMDKSQLVDVINKIMEGKRVVAMYAPSIVAQFSAVSAQLEGAFRAAGFYKTFEVAIGADITAEKEAREFEHRNAHGNVLMTTSCCPAYVRAVQIHVPDLRCCISGTRSPMHYTAELARKENPEYVTVFIGPCLAKRKEGLDDPFVDYVLSAEELDAFFTAKRIDIGKCDPVPAERETSASGRGFAQSGGVAEAVKLRVAHPEDLRPFVINGLDRNGMKQLVDFGEIARSGIPAAANLVEVMACRGGCIAGPSVIANAKIAAMRLKKYAEDGKKT